MAGAGIVSCPPAEVDIARARTTADRDMGMAGPGTNRDMRDMATHIQARVPALPMPDRARAVDAPVVDDLVVDDQAVVTAAADVPVVMVTAAGITVIKNSLCCERGHLGRVALSALRYL